STLMLLFFALNMIVDKKEEKEINYKGLAMTINGEVVEELPTEGYYYLNSTCEGGNLTWDIYNRTLKLKGDGSLNYSSCKLDFESIDLKIYISGVESNTLPTTEGYSVSSNCGNATVTYAYPNLSITATEKPVACEINFYPTLKKVILLADGAISDENIDYTCSSEGNCYITIEPSPKAVPTDELNKIPTPEFLIKDDLSNLNKLTATDSSQITNGLYYTEENTEGNERVYFYRGAVTNNYLVFGNYCWRIVRTVEDGSIRLRYGGTPTQNGETYICPQTGTAVNIGTNQQYFTSDSNKNDVNYKTSSIRTVVENWYRDNIWKNGQNTKVTNLVADTPYCNDMSEGNIDASRVFFGAHERLYRNGLFAVGINPQYKCEDSVYAYTVAKGDLTYPVGLLTADEVAYAGGVFFLENSSYYLNTGEDYWTMSPNNFYYSDAEGIIVKLIGILSANAVNAEASVLPVISLKNEAAVKRGTGAYNDPYVIFTGE
ncbi:MAG: hypothetical protein IJB82_00435, partial [Bacilli bacterium]|nr:hypothetical protein [Bacilli bacterium]